MLLLLFVQDSCIYLCIEPNPDFELPTLKYGYGIFVNGRRKLPESHEECIIHVYHLPLPFLISGTSETLQLRRNEKIRKTDCLDAKHGELQRIPLQALPGKI